jgi:hypothetical protein
MEKGLLDHLDMRGSPKEISFTNCSLGLFEGPAVPFSLPRSEMRILFNNCWLDAVITKAKGEVIYAL